jgi:two-component system, NarL family, response regulator NreC
MRVILVDEQRVFRDTFRLALWHEASIAVVGETDSARQLYSLIETEKPDLVVSELMLKDTDSISAARELRRRRVPVRMMLLTTYSNPLFLSDALDAGVVAYALKEQSLADIVTAMQTAARGETYVTPQLASELPTADRRNQRKPANGATGINRLSHREREVFCRIIQGHSSQAIADSLCISVKTVETHRTHINRKLGVRSPVELIRLAALQGLLAREAPQVQSAASVLPTPPTTTPQ